ncbi:MAG: hypothetical protein WBI18_01090 [Candidatus Saccharicenans sp.]
MAITRKLSYLIKRAILFILIISSSVAVGLAVSQEINSETWDKAQKSFETYFSFPSRANSCKALANLPAEEMLGKMPWTFRAIINYEFNPTVLAMDAESGNICAAQIISKLLKYDSGSRSSFVFSIWRLIRNRPEIFLKAFREENFKSLFLQLILPITLDKLSRERVVYEINTRGEALQSVKAPELAEKKEKYINFFEWYLDWKKLKNVTFCREEFNAKDFPLEMRIRNAINEVINVPCPENIKRLMGILSEWPRIRDIIDVDAGNSQWLPLIQRLREVLREEALCGNKYAVDFLIKYNELFINPSPLYSGLMSEIMFVNPGLFISSLDNNREKLTPSLIREYCCALPLWYQADSLTFYERKIEALNELKMPENKKLIDFIISLLRNEINKEEEKIW